MPTSQSAKAISDGAARQPVGIETGGQAADAETRRNAPTTRAAAIVSAPAEQAAQAMPCCLVRQARGAGEKEQNEKDGSPDAIRLRPEDHGLSLPEAMAGAQRIVCLQARMARRKKGDKIDGWVVLDKPVGLGSTPAVSRVRRLFGAQKAGHGGTLDPLASGVLPIALGEATKTVPFVMDGRKEYRFTLRFGEARSNRRIGGRGHGFERGPADRPGDPRRLERFYR